MATSHRVIQKPKRSGKLSDSDVVIAIEKVIAERTEKPGGGARKRTMRKKAARKKTTR